MQKIFENNYEKVGKFEPSTKRSGLNIRIPIERKKNKKFTNFT